MRSLQEVKSILSAHKQDLFRDYPLKNMAIFGSFAREDHKSASDIDILVEFNKRIGIEFIDLADEMERILELKVDLVSKNGVMEKYLTSMHAELIYI